MPCRAVLADPAAFPDAAAAEVARLRYAARLAYLDGRTARARALNRRADSIAAARRRSARP